MQYTVITGASAGIGKAIAYKFAEKGHNLIITARRETELQQIKQDIEKKFSVKVLVVASDLSKAGEPLRFFNAISKYDLKVFINNAGFGDFAMPWEVNIDKACNMIDLNVRALAELSLRFAAKYADKQSTLINVSSVGGYAQFGPAATYSATKFFVSSFTEGIASAIKTSDKLFRVKVLAPGATESEFVQEAGKNAAINPNDLFPDKSKFIAASQLAEYAFELFESDKVVGIVNGENQFELKDPIFPLFG